MPSFSSSCPEELNPISARPFSGDSSLQEPTDHLYHSAKWSNISVKKRKCHLLSNGVFACSDRTVVCVATVTDDVRLESIPALNVAALHFTESARARIIKAGGSCQTIDELIMKTPTGTSTFFCFSQSSLIFNYKRYSKILW